MRILIDGIFFQLAQSGIARVWKSIIPIIKSFPDTSIIIADRGGCPQFEGALSVPFPAYHAPYASDDSILLQKLCDFYKIDVFLSTFFTTPIKTPSVQVIYDMIPEIFSFNLGDRFWAEKEVAVSYARWFVCISQNTKSDLLNYYPEIHHKKVLVEYPGYDRSVFVRKSEAEIAEFSKKYGISRPFLLMVGSREQNKGYKNGQIVFDALLKAGRRDLDVLCIGGEEEFDDALLARVGDRFGLQRITADDHDLACAYSAARAFVYPSLYEGFGLPVVEAMACGCPVITTNKGSLKEIAKDPVCLIVDPDSVDDVIRALELLDDEARTCAMSQAGQRECLNYNWRDISEALHKACYNATGESRSDENRSFYENWARLRIMQSEVNTKTMS